MRKACLRSAMSVSMGGSSLVFVAGARPLED
jgi:hypothetical protein